MANYNKKIKGKKSKRVKSKIPQKYVSKKMSEVAVKKIVNKEFRKRTEVKKLDYNYGNVNINHNNYSAVPANKFQNSLMIWGTNMPVAGTSDGDIIGSRFKVIGQQLFLQFQIVSDRLNSKFRVMILRYPSYRVVNAYTDIFDNVTNNIMMDPIDKDICTVLYDKVVGIRNINPTNATDNVLITRKIWVPKQKYTVQYENAGLNTVKTPRFTDYLIILGYDAFGSLQTDTIGSVQVSRRLYFVDDI